MTAGQGTGAGGAGTSGGAVGAAGNATVGVGAAGSSNACPPLRPVEDTACTRNTQTCTYDEIDCQCPSGTWLCSEPVDPNCPAMMPAHDSVCMVPEGTECEFLQDECECLMGRWTCESAEMMANPPAAGTGAPAAGASAPAAGMGAAGMSAAGAPAAGTGGAGGMQSGPMCPDLRPIEGLPCMVHPTGCTYDTTFCVCPMGSWLCSESVDPSCPAEPPTPDSACAGNADCDYFDIECECLASRWSCKAND